MAGRVFEMTDGGCTHNCRKKEGQRTRPIRLMARQGSVDSLTLERPLFGQTWQPHGPGVKQSPSPKVLRMLSPYPQCRRSSRHHGRHFGCCGLFFRYLGRHFGAILPPLWRVRFVCRGCGGQHLSGDPPSFDYTPWGRKLHQMPPLGPGWEPNWTPFGSSRAPFWSGWAPFWVTESDQ